MPKPTLEDRELATIADLLDEKLLDTNGDTISSYERKSLVRLAVVLNSLGEATTTQRLQVLTRAPAWVYAYMAKGIIALPAPAKPERPAARAKRAARTGA